MTELTATVGQTSLCIGEIKSPPGMFMVTLSKAGTDFTMYSTKEDLIKLFDPLFTVLGD